MVGCEAIDIIIVHILCRLLYRVARGYIFHKKHLSIDKILFSVLLLSIVSSSNLLISATVHSLCVVKTARFAVKLCLSSNYSRRNEKTDVTFVCKASRVQTVFGEETQDDGLRVKNDILS